LSPPCRTSIRISPTKNPEAIASGSSFFKKDKIPQAPPPARIAIAISINDAAISDLLTGILEATGAKSIWDHKKSDRFRSLLTEVLEIHLFDCSSSSEDRANSGEARQSLLAGVLRALL
jgi:hypothetical protein